MTSAYFKSLSVEEQIRYRDKLNLFSDITLPDPYDSRNSQYFVKDISLWPCITWPDLYAYLIETPGPYSRESLKAYKSLEAYNYYVSEKIQSLQVYATKETSKLRVLLGFVLPGQRSAEPYKCWVIAEEEGAVLSAHCQCMAGLGEVCSHVAGILFLVEAAVRDGKNRVSVTSKECVWKKAEKTIDPATVINIDFSKPIRGRLTNVPTTKQVGLPTARGSSKELLSMLANVYPNAKVLKHYPAKSFDPEETESASEDEGYQSFLPHPLTELYDQKYEVMESMELGDTLISVFDSMQITRSEANYLEQATRHQRKCEAWTAHRRGRLTASQFHRVLTMKETTSPLRLVGEVVGYTGTISSAATSWGIKHEEDAKKLFLKEMIKLHQDFRCYPIGLVVNTKWSHLGASPDGYVECKCCGKAILEIKCPYSHRLSTFEQATEDSSFFLDKSGMLRKNHGYYTQVQGQLYITDAEFCYFVVFIANEVRHQKIYPEKHFWEDTLKPRLDIFYISNVLPELLTRRREAGKAKSGEEPLYCFCKKPAEGRMIACDSDTCEKVWFHFRCINIKRKPTGKWFCSACK